MDRKGRFLDEHHLRVGTIDFHCEFPMDREPPDDRLYVMKTREMVEDYFTLFESLRPAAIVELGVEWGGSTALLSELADPLEKLVAIELDPTPPPALEHYIEANGLGEVVRPHYGVDQGDRERLARIVDAELGGRPLDLVLDDASHLYGPSLASFEVLFPRLRPGGVFVFEDWSGPQMIADVLHEMAKTPEGASAVAAARADGEGDEPETPLFRLILELVLARAGLRSGIVAELTVGPYWVAVRRGPGGGPDTPFRVADLYVDHFGILTEEGPPPAGGAPPG